MRGLTSFDDIVKDYVAHFRSKRLAEDRWFSIQRSLDDVIQKAAMAMSPSGKRLNHQRRIPKEALRAWSDSLMERRSAIRQCTTFEELEQILSRSAAGIHGIGALTVYDTATRIGAFLHLEPQLIYLHAGVRQGAKALGFGDRATLVSSDLPKPFRRLPPGEIEDCLCIYKEALRTIMQRSPSKWPRRAC